MCLQSSCALLLIHALELTALEPAATAHNTQLPPSHCCLYCTCTPALATCPHCDTFPHTHTHSPSHAGGQPYSVLGVVDAMQSIKPDVQTVALGACYSYASLVVVSMSCGKGGPEEEVRGHCKY